MLSKSNWCTIETFCVLYCNSHFHLFSWLSLSVSLHIWLHFIATLYFSNTHILFNLQFSLDIICPPFVTPYLCIPLFVCQNPIVSLRFSLFFSLNFLLSLNFFLSLSLSFPQSLTHSLSIYLPSSQFFLFLFIFQALYPFSL